MMAILSEIADKMPSASGIVAVCAVLAATAVGVACLHRAAAWCMLLLAVGLGVVVAFDGYHESFVEGPFTDAIWDELGWPWVLASIGGPLLPAVAVIVFMVVRRQWGQHPKIRHSAFPPQNHPASCAALHR